MKKFVSSLILVCILAIPLAANATTLTDQARAVYASMPQQFSDLPTGHVNFSAVSMLSEFGVIKGYEDGTFKPDSNVNRAELVKMVVAWLMGEVTPEAAAKYKNCFPDVKEEWFAPYICYAKEQGWVSGYPDGNFRPGNNVNRVEAIKIIENVMLPDMLWPSPTDAEAALPLPSDAESGQWYSGQLMFAIAKELLDGQHVTQDPSGAYYYKPAEPMTRKEVAEMMYRMVMWMQERIEYADLVREAACIQINNADMTDEEQKALWVEQALTPFGVTEADADALTAKYGSDDVMDALIQDGIQDQCGDASAVDMTKWEDALTRFGA